MADLEGVLRFPLTDAGIADARKKLDDFKSKLKASTKTQSDSPGLILYKHLGLMSLGRELLRVLPEGRANGLTPEELGKLMNPGPGRGKPLEKASVRAVIRNANKGADHLASLGRLTGKVVQADFDGYDADGAGRYYLNPGDAAGIPGR